MHYVITYTNHSQERSALSTLVNLISNLPGKSIATYVISVQNVCVGSYVPRHDLSASVSDVSHIHFIRTYTASESPQTKRQIVAEGSI